MAAISRLRSGARPQSARRVASREVRLRRLRTSTTVENAAIASALHASIRSITRFSPRTGWIAEKGRTRQPISSTGCYEKAKGNPEWFTLWQDADSSVASEDDATIALLRQAMANDRALIAKGLMTQAE